MNKQKMEELIDLLDDTIQEEKEFVGPEDAEEYRQSQIRIFNFNEIKGIVEKYEKLTEAGEDGLNVFYLAGYEDESKSGLFMVNLEKMGMYIRNILNEKGE